MKIRARTVGGLIGALLVSVAAPASAEESTSAEAVIPPAPEILAAEAVEALAEQEPSADPSAGVSLETYWGRRLSNAMQRIELATERSEKSEAEYSRARHKHNPRGEALEEIRDKRDAAERELHEAEAALPRLVEQARRAGVEPGVLRDYWDEP